MKKTLLFLSLAFLICGKASAQKDNAPYTAFSFGLFPPLCTNGTQAAEYTNGASVNLLIGNSRNEENLVVSGLCSLISERATGVQIAGISNYIGHEGKGLVLAGLTNITRESYTGMQLSGMVNRSGEHSRGVMVGGLFNSTKGHFKGLQFTGMCNIADGFKGMQFSGLVNYSGDNSKGVMFGGLSNSTKGRFKGVQFAGLLNTAGNVKGVQFAGLLNTAKDVKGVQFAGLVNVAEEVTGVQFAALVNVAEESDFPIGIINIIKEGEKGIALTYDMLGNAVVSFRSGGKYTYGILGVGYNHKADGNGITTEAGYGIHIPVCKWFELNNEFKATTIGASSSLPVLNFGYLFAPSFRIGKHYNLFGGVSREATATDLYRLSGRFPIHLLTRRRPFRGTASTGYPGSATRSPTTVPETCPKQNDGHGPQTPPVSDLTCPQQRNRHTAATDGPTQEKRFADLNRPDILSYGTSRR